jgi:hypothetical protein
VRPPVLSATISNCAFATVTPAILAIEASIGMAAREAAADYWVSNAFSSAAALHLPWSDA